MRDMQKNVDALVKQLYKKQLVGEFNSVDRREFAKLSDKELAVWQSEHPINSPQYILAEQEWQRRLMVDQIKGSRFAAYIGVIGTIIGAITTWMITKWP